MTSAKIMIRLDGVELGSPDERGDHGPVLGAGVGAGEQRILASEPRGRIVRSTTLLSISMRPSSRNRLRPCQRDTAYRIASASLVFRLMSCSLSRSHD